MKCFMYNAILPTLASLIIGITGQYANAQTTQPTASASPQSPPALQSINQLGDLHFRAPTMHRFTTEDGVSVIFTPIADLPIVDISVSFAAGFAYDEYIQKNGFGISYLVATLLTQGTKNQSEEDFLAHLESLGVQLSANSSADFLTVQLRSLSNPQTLTPAIQLLTEAITQPAFHQTALERQKSKLISHIQIQEQDPGYIAQIAYNKALFGTHPYAHPATGDTQSLPTIQKSHLDAFHQQFIHKQNAYITITGNLTLAQARALAAKISQPLAQGQKAPTISPPQKPKSAHIHVDFNSTQTQILLGQLTAAFDNSPKALQENLSFDVANEILAGGDFSARLMDVIRVQKGYTYGIYGYNQRNKATGAYTISFSTQNSTAADAIKDTLQVIKQTQQSGVSHDELSLAVFNHQNSYPAHFASNAGIHQIAHSIHVRDLPKDYLDTYIQRLHAITLQSANTALAQLNPDDFVIISVGPQKPNF